MVTNYAMSLPNKLYVELVPLMRKKRPYEKCLKSDTRMTLTKFYWISRNWNVKAKVTGIAFILLIRYQIPDEAVQRMSMHQEYADDRDWIEALRQAVSDDEDFQEAKRFKDKNFSGSSSSGKRKLDEPITAKTRKNPSIPLRRKRYTRQRTWWRR